MRYSILVLSLFVTGPGGADQPSPAPGPEVIAPGLKPRCDFAGGSVDRYLLVLDANQMLDVAVDQRGVDVAVTLEDPDGEVLFERDGLTGPVGKEQVLSVIRDSGRYGLVIAALETQEPAGCYEISYKAADAALPRDAQLAAAAKTMADALGELEKDVALRKLGDALARWEALGEPAREAEALTALGIHHFDDDPEKAHDDLTKALAKASGDPALLALVHSQLGRLYDDKFRDLESARGHMQEAMKLWKERFGARRWEAGTAHDLGFVHYGLGEFDDALFYFSQAISLWRELRLSAFEARSLNNRAWIHFYFRRLDLAYEDLRDALAIKDRLGTDRSSTLTLISYVHTERGELEDAFRVLDTALAGRTDRRGRAVTQMALGWAHHRANRPDTALELYGEALETFRELGDATNEARALHRMGLVRQENGEHDQALLHFRQAFAGFEREGYADGKAESLLAIARSERQMGQLKTALATVDRALEIVEELRKEPFTARLRAIFFASKRHFFDFKIELLMALHRLDPDRRYDVEALTVSERSRSRSLLETLNESGVDLRAGMPPDLIERMDKLRRTIKTKIYQSRERPEAIGETRAEMELLEQEYDRIRDSLREDHPFYSNLTEARPLSVEAIQRQVLDEGTLLLEYYLGEDRSYLWAVTKDSVKSLELDVEPRLVEDIARRVYRLLPVGRQRKYRVQLEWELDRLSGLVLAAVAEELRGKDRLLIVGGGALQYVPFGALPIPGAAPGTGWPVRLVSEHEIVSLPSASTLAVLREVAHRENGRRAAAGSAVVIADPVYHLDDRAPDNGGVTRGLVIGRLKYSGMEAEAIRALLPDARIATGFEASKELATSRELGGFRYVHLATHGTFDAQFPERSGLIFSLYDREGGPREGRLYLPEIYQLGLSADLVVLSACQTALGEEIRGEGLMGMTQGFMYSGTPRVIASLWNVLDESTAALMKLFYQNLIAEKLSPAAAFRKAQADFLDLYPQWSEPYYWAGFILQGDF
jgi:CHAT domain-containing protein/Tfp pilus assembly protein PilF